MTRVLTRSTIVLKLLAGALVIAGVSLAPAASHAGPARTGEVVVATVQAETIPPPTLSYYIPKAYRQGYRKAVRHYRQLQARPVVSARVDWWTPSIPDWVEEAAERVVEPFAEAKWWIEHGLKCGAAVGSIWVAGGGKLASIVLKIAKLSKSDRAVRRARRAINRLGGVREAMSLLGRYAKSRGGGVTSTEKRLLGVVVRSGGAVVANLLGVTSCVAMVKRVI